MKESLPAASDFRQLDMTSWQTAIIPLNFRSEQQVDVLPLLLSSQTTRKVIRWTNDLSVYAELSSSGNGTAYFEVLAQRDMVGGRIKELESLYSGVVSVSPRTEQLAWKTIGRTYMKALMESDDPRMCALGDMPDAHPWVAGFLHTRTAVLGSGRNVLIPHVRAVAAALVTRCRDVFVSDSSQVIAEQPLNPEDERGFGGSGEIEFN